MYAEEQTHQNLRENKTGEEKPLQTKEENVKNEMQEQISVKEQREIQSLLKDPAETLEAHEESTAEDQLSDQEKKEIVTLLKDESVAVEPPEKKPKKKKIGKQITAEENQEIRRLINDGYASEKKETARKEINYDELNKQQLVEMLEEVVEEKDITKIKNKLSKIKTVFHRRNKEEIERARKAFLNEGGRPEDFKHVEDPLEQRFNAAFAKYRQHKARYAEDLEKQKTENLQIKLNILEELKELINSEETLKKTYDEFRNLQDRWKQVGMVPAGELNNLWQNYHFLVEMFFDKVRINKELRDLD
ncbi:MAG: DUF349 domain-containing protein, partial [bacterium]